MARKKATRREKKAPEKPQAKFGIIGMAVMGQNLALNVESQGYPCAVYNRTGSKTKAFVQERCQDRKIVPAYSLKKFVASIQRPRKVMLMVKAGEAVDAFIDKLVPLLDKGDLIIDGGNSFFKDTIRRNRELEKKGILYIGTGVSGGEEGALHGPAIMPGGQKKAWNLVRGVFQKIAAHVNGDPCCTYIGSDGAGHYVKMVHNGIEYGDMQLIAEAYTIMANALGLDADELQKVFQRWNRGDLDSYLIEITADIFGRQDPETGNPLVEMILDTAKQKGTGKWTSQDALDLGIPAPTIAEAVFARCVSAIKDERVEAAKVLKGPRSEKWKGIGTKKAVNAIRKALYASKVCSYAQGFALMREAAEEYGWDLKFGEIAMIWRGGCIIRAQFLQKIKDAYDRDPELPNLLLDPYFRDVVHRSQKAWRQVVSTASQLGIPIPAFSSALSYFDSYRRERLPANLIQAQRDYFGAHTYERVDKEGTFHTEWTK
ncbi:MAG: NADP-dependent phosphogluconate dehydrogenase [Candidatus Brocadiia bacterium]